MKKKNWDLHDGSWLRWIKSDKNVDGNGGAWISLKKIIIIKNIINSNLINYLLLIIDSTVGGFW